MIIMETKTLQNQFYTCFGRFRPPCRINHKTFETAQKCLERDRQLCRRFNGVSDRYIAKWDGGKFENVTLPRSGVEK